MLSNDETDVISRIPAFDSLGDIPSGVLATVVQDMIESAAIADGAEAQFMNYVGDLRGDFSP